MKAIFNRNGSTVAPRAAALLVKLGLAKFVDEPVMTKEVVEDEKVEVIPTRKLTVIEQPKVPKQELKTKVKTKGRPVKAKK